MASDATISPAGTPEGMRAIITIGDVNGIIDSNVASDESGFWPIVIENMRPRITGIMQKPCSCAPS